MNARVLQGSSDALQQFRREWSLASGGLAMTAKGSLQCAFDECSCTVGTDIREEGFEVVAYTRKVGFNGFRVDVVALEGDVVAESFGCGVNGKVM